MKDTLRLHVLAVYLVMEGGRMDETGRMRAVTITPDDGRAKDMDSAGSFRYAQSYSGDL